MIFDMWQCFFLPWFAIRRPMQALCGVYSDDFNYSSSQKLLQGGLQQQLEKACRGTTITSYNSSISTTNTWNNHSSWDAHLHQSKLSASKKVRRQYLKMKCQHEIQREHEMRTLNLNKSNWGQKRQRGGGPKKVRVTPQLHALENWL